MPPKEKKTEGVKAKGKAAAKTASKVTKAVAKATKGKSSISRPKSPALHTVKQQCVALCVHTR